MRIRWWWMVVAVTGCGFGSGALEEVDPAAAVEAPTWSADVEPLMVLYCTACHSPDAQTGTTAGYDYEGCEATRGPRNWRGVVKTVFDGNTMPPGGAARVSERDRLTLTRWADQGSTCD